MQKNTCTRQFVLLAVIAGMAFFAAETRASTVVADSNVAERSDVINIDAMTIFGPIERPTVEFLHDKHTQAAKKMGKDCLTCHPRDEDSGQLSIRYMRFGDMDKKTVMDTYHAGCITCHNEQLSAGETSGPVVCAGCHGKTKKTISNRQTVVMDNSLHLRHIRKTKGGCRICHHVYDAEAKKLVYKRREESACRYCHPDLPEDDRMTIREASHTACIGCHRRLTVQNKSSGPMECIACHDAEHQANIEKLPRVPRLRAGQPDFVFIKTEGEGDTEVKAARMNPVPFDHKAHETYNDTCHVCHHATLTGCGECHSTPGKREGSGISLEQAMHRNCIGCHEQRQLESACAGCHGFMSQSRQMPQTYCSTCHMAPPVGEVRTDADRMPVASAAEMLAARTPTLATYDMADVPEKVTIESLSETYAPVDMPHGKIVSALVNGIENNKLTAYFHTERGTLCRGCHHNSPATKTPPRCVSCHDKPFQEKTLFRPGLMAAYHQQCMGCHDQMGIEKPASRDCIGCHKEKRNHQ